MFLIWTSPRRNGAGSVKLHHPCRRHSPIGIPSSAGMPMAGAAEVDFTGQALLNTALQFHRAGRTKQGINLIFYYSKVGKKLLTGQIWVLFKSQS